MPANPKILIPVLFLWGSLSPLWGQANPHCLGSLPTTPPTVETSQLLYRFDTKTSDGSPGQFSIYYTLSGPHRVRARYLDSVGPVVMPREDCPDPDPSLATWPLQSGRGEYDRDNAPTFVERIGVCLEYALAKYRQHGFVIDSADFVRTVIIWDLPEKYAGYAIPPVAGVSHGQILIDPVLSAENMLPLMSHEVFHHIQFTYPRLMAKTITRGHWITEGTATWAEDLIDDCANDYSRQVNDFLNDIGIGLEDSTYGGVLFWKYLTEVYGQVREEPKLGLDVLQTLLESWDRSVWTSPREDIDHALLSLGATENLDQAYLNFAERILVSGTYPETSQTEYEPWRYVEDEEFLNRMPVHRVNNSGDPDVTTLFRSFSGELSPYSLHAFRFIASAEAQHLILSAKAPEGSTLQARFFLRDEYAIETMGAFDLPHRTVLPLAGDRELLVAIIATAEGGEYKLTIGPHPDIVDRRDQ